MEEKGELPAKIQRPLSEDTYKQMWVLRYHWLLTLSLLCNTCYIAQIITKNVDEPILRFLRGIMAGLRLVPTPS
jgi:hypothetical protein